MSLTEAPDRETAKRLFVELLNSPKPNLITNYIDEFILYELGDFDNRSGEILVNPAPVSIMTGLECVKEYKARKDLLDKIYSTPSPSGDEDKVDIPEFLKEENNVN